MAQVDIAINMTRQNYPTYTYPGADNAINCTLINQALAAGSAEAANVGVFVFSLDAPSVAAGWTMTGCQMPEGSPLVATPGEHNQSYTVYDPDMPMTGGPYHFLFTFSHPSTGTVSFDPEIDNQQNTPPPMAT